MFSFFADAKPSDDYIWLENWENGDTDEEEEEEEAEIPSELTVLNGLTIDSEDSDEDAHEHGDKASKSKSRANQCYSLSHWLLRAQAWCQG